MPFFSRSERNEPARDRGISFDVDSFEFGPAGDGLGLLRLTGVWGGDEAVPPPIEVEIERDGDSVRLTVLPDPSVPDPASGAEWRGAFMVDDAELALDPRADFALVAGGEVVAGLPSPAEPNLDEGYVDTADEDQPPAAEVAGGLAGPPESPSP